ncbi:PP2C family protein-serine/threonine phosphatase [Actinacidiphila alni]|uniref:PP2C family protein-serine/threonine phosphatase n=1 Tax=Actinacidiphila alni TaxID=380248 RepID=UPI00340DD9F9
MTTIPARRRSWWQTARRDPVLMSPLLLTVVIGVLAFVTPDNVAVSRLLPAAPALAASMWSVAATVALGAVAICVVIAVALVLGTPGMLFTAVAIGAVTAAAGYAAYIRLQRERTLTEVRSVADAAQAVVLRPVPPRIGRIDIATLYVAAAAQARIGGDFYAAVETPYGVRLLIGDVRGKGLAAAGVAGAVANCFREAAHDEPDLAALARRLDTSLGRYSASLPAQDASERFATALLAEIPAGGGPAALLNCGHPPPLLLHAGRVTTLDPAVPSPPLNMAALIGSGYHVESVPLAAGDQLLLYTDGVTETRDRAGAFFPLHRWANRRPPAEPAEFLGRLRAELLRYSGGRLDDDIAAMLIRCRAGGQVRRLPGVPGGGVGSGAGGGPGEDM